MNYNEIITNVAKTLDPGLAINVTIVTNKDLGEAHLVAADIEYPDVEYTIPFIVYNDGEVFMPSAWGEGVPETADDIENIKWVSFPDNIPGIIINGLPKVFI